MIDTRSQCPINNAMWESGSHLALFFAGSRCSPSPQAGGTQASTLPRKRSEVSLSLAQAQQRLSYAIFARACGHWAASTMARSRRQSGLVPCAEIVEACRLNRALGALVQEENCDLKGTRSGTADASNCSTVTFWMQDKSHRPGGYYLLGARIENSRRGRGSRKPRRSRPQHQGPAESPANRDRGTNG